MHKQIVLYSGQEKPKYEFTSKVFIIIFFGAVALGIIKFIWTTTIRRNLFDCIVYASVEYKTFRGSVFYANEHFFFVLFYIYARFFLSSFPFSFILFLSCCFRSLSAFVFIGNTQSFSRHFYLNFLTLSILPQYIQLLPWCRKNMFRFHESSCG